MMEAHDQVDDRTFRVNFSGEGVLKLRERVTEKLKEFMGDYTDETLVEYVIVLLRNGRHKKEAKNELDVFLDNDSDSFVDWLWEHLSSNLDQYVQASESPLSEAVKTKSKVEANAGRNKIQHFESDQLKSIRVSNIRRKREWKGLVEGESEHPLLCSTAPNDFYTQSREPNCDDNRKRRSISPRIHDQRKRSLAADPLRCKMTMNAPKRLLQFAVRDAVATNRSSTASSEPVAKRLRSVVSTSVSESAQETRPHLMQSIARQPSAMAVAIKAVAEAAQDVSRMRFSTRNVFDRLGHGVTVPENISRVPISREGAVDVEVNEDYYEPQGEIGPVDFCQSVPEIEEHQVDYFQGGVDDDLMGYHQPQAENNTVEYCFSPEKEQQIYVHEGDYGGPYSGDQILRPVDTVLASHSASDDDGYGNIDVCHRTVMRHTDVDASRIGLSTERIRDSVAIPYRVGQDTDKFVRQAHVKYQDPSVSAAHTSQLDAQQSLLKIEVGGVESSAQSLRGNPLAVDGNGKHEAEKLDDASKSATSRPGSYSTAHHLEDADARTIFVNNVHFGATKDSLSRHFNQCGEVLKVIILTDAATGQPRGSAYVEFLRKEAVENALSLDGSYFMARMLKVVTKSSAPQELSPATTRPRVSRGVRYAWGASFPRGCYRPGAYAMPRPPIIRPGGARSMQWRRDAQTTQAADSSAASNSTGAGRGGLTYVRTA